MDNNFSSNNIDPNTKNIMQNGDEPIMKRENRSIVNYYINRMRTFAWHVFRNPEYTNARNIAMVVLSGPIAIVFFSYILKYAK